MSSAMAVRALLKTVLLVKLVFMTAPTLRMLESDVRVCGYVLALNCMVTIFLCLGYNVSFVYMYTVLTH